MAGGKWGGGSWSRLREILKDTTINLWTLSGTQFKQTNCKKVCLRRSEKCDYKQGIRWYQGITVNYDIVLMELWFCHQVSQIWRVASWYSQEQSYRMPANRLENTSPGHTAYNSLLGGSAGKESAYNSGDLDSISGLGRSSGGGHGNPLQYSCLENPHRQKSLKGHSPWGHKESYTAE